MAVSRALPPLAHFAHHHQTARVPHHHQKTKTRPGLAWTLVVRSTSSLSLSLFLSSPYLLFSLVRRLIPSSSSTRFRPLSSSFSSTLVLHPLSLSFAYRPPFFSPQTCRRRELRIKGKTLLFVHAVASFLFYPSFFLEPFLRRRFPPGLWLVVSASLFRCSLRTVQ